MAVTPIERHSGVSYFSVASPGVDSVTVDENGNLHIRGLRVFREGTFRDSMGDQHTWTGAHLEQMVFHFGMLRDGGILPNVPVRHNHPSLFGGGGEVIGYFTEVRHEANFLVADLELIDPAAIERWQRGLYRARSLEVGMYETNDESVFWPVVMGVAFVDIPAVEGLYGRPDPIGRRAERTVFATHTEETPMSTTATEVEPGQEVEPPQEENPAGTPAPDADEGDEGSEGGQSDQGQGTSNNAAARSSFSTSISGAGVQAFRVQGRPVSDFAAVQAHIDSLERFAKETADANRRAFVQSLASDHKIAGTQVDSLTAHALGLNDEQYAAFTAAYANAPQLRLFGEFGGGVTNPAGETSTTDDELVVLEETVAMHRRSGMPDEKVRETPSFKRLEALRATTK